MPRDPAHGVDQPRRAAFLRLSPQVADVHVERIGARAEVVAPDALEDDRARQHLPGIPQEQLEQRELGARELDRRVAAPDLARSEVELEVGEPQSRVRGLVVARRAPEQRAQPSEELRQGERLGEIVVRAGIEAGDTAVHLRARREHQHGHRVGAGAQPAADLEAVDPGHQHIQDDRVRSRRAHSTQRHLAVLRELDVVSLELEGPPQRLANGALVVHDQDLHRPHCALRAAFEPGS
jgi:hypothetical protein